jgi:hypothetical protein
MIREIRHLLRPIRRRTDYILYNHRLDSIKQEIRKKEKIKVVFFVINVGMWKSDLLFQKLLSDDRFAPFIAYFPLPNEDRECQKQNQDKLENYFIDKGFPFIKTFHYQKNEWFDMQSFHPEIMFYAQPYGGGYKELRIDSFWKYALFYYFSYSLDVVNGNQITGSFLPNICFLFAPTEYHKKDWSQTLLTRGKNVVVTGYPTLDYFRTAEKSDTKWKNFSFKRIIWAPHHSINPEDTFHFSTFLKLAYDMIDLAKAYKNQIDFAFKPHPSLKGKLYNHPQWGREKTDSYYNLWAKMDNTILADGEYVELFINSDAMIHDCGSFMAEYLATYNPVMYLERNNYEMPLNDFGWQCFEQHYHGESIDDIKNFIDDVVLGGNDPLFNKRESFVRNYLLPPNGYSVAENMYNEMLKLFE